MQSRFALVVILTVAATLRLWGLGRDSLWLDEAISVLIARTDPRTIWASTFDPNTPFYYLILHFWMKLFGHSEAAVRLPSLLFDLVTVGLTYWLGALTFSRKAGLLAAVLVAVSPFHIYFAQEARAYSLLAMLALLSTIFFLRAIDANRWADWGGFFAASLLALYTHYFAVFMVFAQGVFLLGFGYRQNAIFTRGLIATGAVGLLFLPRLLSLFAMAASTEGQTFRRLLSLKLPYIFMTFSFGYSGVNISSRLVGREIPLSDVLSQYLVLLVAGLLVFGTAFARGLWVAFRQGPAGRFLALYYLLPIFTVFVISLKIPVLSERYLNWIAPVYALLIALGLLDLWPRRPARLLHLGLALILMYSLWNQYFAPIGKEQWRDVAAYVGEHAQPGDVIVFHKPYVRIPFNYYDSSPLPKYPLPDKQLTAPNPQDHLRQKLGSYHRAWLVLAHHSDTDDYYPQLFRSAFILREQRPYFGVVLELFDLAPPETRSSR